MALLKAEASNSCSLCDTQNVSFYPKRDDHPTKHEMFHAVCDECDYTEPDTSIALCDYCRHLRFSHMIICSGYIFPEFEELTIDFKLRREASKHCEFCLFVTSHNEGRYWKDEKQPTSVILRMSFYSDTSCVIRPLGLMYQAATSTQHLSDLSPHLDWEWFRVWLKPWIEDAKPLKELQYLQRPLSNVRVVDVQDYCLVQLPEGGKYAALSYVWGASCSEDFQTMQSNFQELTIAGGLRSKNLPLTINDAMVVCRNVGIRYLWVDRLCITQDSNPDEKWDQLNQMASIYHQAQVTLVAAAGKNPTYGLPGVTRGRTWKQRRLHLGDDLILQEGAVVFEDLLKQTVWWTRAWTYQEWVASSLLVYFTDHGLRLQQGSDEDGEIASRLESYFSSQTDLGMIRDYSCRALTHSGDVLAAISGLLYGVYGDRTLLGMPLDNFDSAVVWNPMETAAMRREITNGENFPSWSWISIPVPVNFAYSGWYVLGLSCWEFATEKGWQHIQPVNDSETVESFNERCVSELARITTAIAWFHGCIDAIFPDFVIPNCTRETFKSRLALQWPDVESYWQNAHGCRLSVVPFDKLDHSSALRYGHLQVHAQKAIFYVAKDRRKTTRRKVFIRNSSNQVAGVVFLDEAIIASAITSHQTGFTFIALSAADVRDDDFCVAEELLHPDFYRDDIATSKLYGCPCSSIVSPSELWHHFPECPKHANFGNSQYYEHGTKHHIPGSTLKGASDELVAAYSKHMEALSYFGSDGELLHHWYQVPTLNVMLVIPEWSQTLGRNVYKRGGIGLIYLKRWVEASREFDTILLG